MPPRLRSSGTLNAPPLLVRQLAGQHGGDNSRAPHLLLWPGDMPDHGDALVAAAGRTTGLPVLTFDRPFARKLKRLEIAHQMP